MGPRTTLEDVLGVEGIVWALDKVRVVGQVLSVMRWLYSMIPSYLICGFISFSLSYLWLIGSYLI